LGRDILVKHIKYIKLCASIIKGLVVVSEILIYDVLKLIAGKMILNLRKYHM